jgi:hypothetical protein
MDKIVELNVDETKAVVGGLKQVGMGGVSIGHFLRDRFMRFLDQFTRPQETM